MGGTSPRLAGGREGGEGGAGGKSPRKTRRATALPAQWGQEGKAGQKGGSPTAFTSCPHRAGAREGGVGGTRPHIITARGRNGSGMESLQSIAPCAEKREV